MVRFSAGETYSNEGPQCPFCERQFTADESYFYDEHKFTEFQCDDCDKKFKVEVYTSTSWTCTKIKEPTT